MSASAEKVTMQIITNAISMVENPKFEKPLRLSSLFLRISSPP